MSNFFISFFIISQRQISNEEIALISYVIFFTIAVGVMFVLFFTMFQRRKNKMILEKINQQQKFDEELVKTQQEIQEETLKNIGRELHDNVGQLLAVAAMQLNTAAKVVKDDVKTKLDNATEALKDALSEVRALSKSLNSDVIFNLGFECTVKNELGRLEKSGLIETDLKISGNKVDFENKKDEIILFRILQEFFSNTLKYADAETLKVELNYLKNSLNIIVRDNGKGFNVNSAERGSGLINMEKRAQLLEADFELESKIGEGTVLSMSYAYRSN